MPNYITLSLSNKQWYKNISNLFDGIVSCEWCGRYIQIIFNFSYQTGILLFDTNSKLIFGALHARTHM